MPATGERSGTDDILGGTERCNSPLTTMDRLIAALEASETCNLTEDDIALQEVNQPLSTLCSLTGREEEQNALAGE